MPDILNMLLNIDQYMGAWVAQYGVWIYLVLFVIIFSETGLVVVPFLPGDSLLFIAGAFGASELINPVWLGVLLTAAAILGNSLNYAVGRYIGPRVFSANFRFLNRGALMKAHAFYEKHGGKTIVLSRFLPLIRTFAPFVAGVAAMNFVRFQLFNVAGAVLWVAGLITLGYFFGNVPIIKEHLNTIVLIGVGAAIVPVVAGALWRVCKRRAAS